MATSNNTIRLSSVTPPEVIKPGSTVDLELNFEQQLKGCYLVSFYPPNLIAFPRLHSKHGTLSGDVLELNSPTKGFRLHVEIPVDVTISGTETLNVKLQQLDVN